MREFEIKNLIKNIIVENIGLIHVNVVEDPENQLGLVNRQHDIF